MIDNRLIIELLVAAALVWPAAYIVRFFARRLTRIDSAYDTLDRQIDKMKQRGIYTIYCTKEDATYTGSTEVNFHVRWGQHIAQLDRGEHPNARLQEAWTTYGPEGFHFFVMEVIDNIEDIRPRELEHLEWRTMNLPAKQNYNVNNSRVRRDIPMPELQFVYPTKIVHAAGPAPRKPIKRRQP